MSEQTIHDGVMQECKLRISQIVDNIVNGNTHPLTAKNDLLEIYKSCYEKQVVLLQEESLAYREKYSKCLSEHIYNKQ